MTKEEKIKEAWGDLWNTFNESAKKCALSKNGCIGSILQNVLNKDFTEFNVELKAWRPKSLKGIEANSGWIKIENEDDLPKEEKDYWVVDSYGEVFICFFDEDYKAFKGYFHYDQKGSITHYQPIEKPKPPLY